jgi:hypothetical protein
VNAVSHDGLAANVAHLAHLNVTDITANDTAKYLDRYLPNCLQREYVKGNVSFYEKLIADYDVAMLDLQRKINDATAGCEQTQSAAQAATLSSFERGVLFFALKDSRVEPMPPSTAIRPYIEPLPSSSMSIKLHLPVLVKKAIPSVWPVSGGTRLIIQGDGFIPVSTAYCVFQYSVFVAARVINSTHLVCITPGLKGYGNLQVHVSLNGRQLSDSFTWYTMLPQVEVSVAAFDN